MLLIVAIQKPYHIFGLPVFQDYYTVHDMEEGRIGFAPHKDSKKTILQTGEIPKQKINSFGKTSDHAKVWPYVIMALLTASASILFYFVIFPAMETSDIHDGITFSVSAVYFAVVGLLFYYVIEPALIRAFSKSGRFITHDESQTMATILNVAFIGISFSGYLVFVRSILNKRAKQETKKKA